MRKKKRSEIDEEEVQKYGREFVEAFTSVPWNRILNMDETAWNFVFVRGEVLAVKGKEEVDAQLPDDYRKSFTAIATISADGSKLPPLFLAKGSSNKCEKQFDGMKSSPDDYFIFHSQGGNTDNEAMLFYLRLVNKWMKNQNCVLILDRYSSHMSEPVLEEAEKLKIKLIFIPTSATDKFQPLDLRVFGALKSSASSFFNDHVYKTGKSYTQAEAADLFVSCWKKLGRNVIASAWNFDSNSDDSDSDDSESTSDNDFVEYDSDYDSEEEAIEAEEIDQEDIRLTKKEAKEPALTPPRPRR